MKAKSIVGLVGQGGQGLGRRRDPQVDPIGHAGPVPRPAADARPFLTHVAAHERSAGGESARDAERGVPGEGADLDGTFDAHQLHQQREQRALLRRYLHPRDRAQRQCLVDEPLLDLVDR